MAGAIVYASADTFAGERMNDEQIRQLVSGNTTCGKSATRNRHGHAHWRADGTVVGWSSEQGARRGTWRTADDRICRRDEGDRERCNEVYDNGDGTYGRYVQPKNLAFPRKHMATWIKVAPGNPENLDQAVCTGAVRPAAVPLNDKLPAILARPDSRWIR